MCLDELPSPYQFIYMKGPGGKHGVVGDVGDVGDVGENLGENLGDVGENLGENLGDVGEISEMSEMSEIGIVKNGEFSAKMHHKSGYYGNCR